MRLPNRALGVGVFITFAVCTALSADGIGSVKVPQFRVNAADTLEDRIASSLGADSTGAVTIAWLQQNDDSTDVVYAKRYDNNGQVTVDQFAVNSDTGYYAAPAVAVDRASGDFVVTWAGGTSYTDSQVHARLYDHTGAPKGPEFTVSSGSEWVTQTYAAMNSSGQFIIGWNAQPAQDQQYPIHAYTARFDAQGAPLGAQQGVGFDSPQGSGLTGVGLSDDGHSSAGWITQDSNGYNDTYAECFDPQGQSAQGLVLVAGSVVNVSIYSSALVTQAADGTIGVAYWGNHASPPAPNGGPPGSYVTAIYAQVLDQSCNVVTGEFAAVPEVVYNANTVPAQFSYSVAIDSATRQLAVGWVEQTQLRNGSTYQPYARLLDFSGKPLSDPVVIGGQSSYLISLAYGSIDGLGNLWLGWKTTVDFTTYGDVFAASVQGVPAGQAVVSVSASSEDFGSVAVGGSASVGISLTNTGNAPLTAISPALGGTNAGDFSIADNGCKPPLPAGQSCALTLAFHPSMAGARAAGLQIASNAANSPVQVALSGTGIAAHEDLSPASLDLGQQSINTRSVTKAVTVGNSGNAVMHLDTPAFIGTNPGDFAVSSSDCGSTLAPGASCAIFVAFTPSGTGARSAWLSLSSNAPNSPGQVPLSGTGIAPNAAASPSSLGFGSQQDNTSGSPKPVTLSNTGTATLHPGTPTIGGPNAADFSLSNSCGAAVQAGQSCIISITFRPSASGSRSATLSIPSDAINGTQSVSLGGTGSTLCLPYLNICLPF